EREAANAVRLLPAGGEQQDADLARLLPAPQLRQHVVSGQVRQHEIQDDGIGPLFAGRVEGFPSSGRRRDSVARLGEMVGDERRDVGFIVDHENPLRGGSVLGHYRSSDDAATAPPSPRATPASTSLRWCTRKATREYATRPASGRTSGTLPGWDSAMVAATAVAAAAWPEGKEWGSGRSTRASGVRSCRTGATARRRASGSAPPDAIPCWRAER